MFDGVVVQPGQEHSFLSAGNFSEAEGFVEGYAIVGASWRIGGGCARSPRHSSAPPQTRAWTSPTAPGIHMVYFYETSWASSNCVQPNARLKWRNDLPGPITIAASSDLSNSTVTFELWVTSDGRQVSYQGPFTKNVVQPGKATWQYDKELRAGQVKQLVHGRPGMQVNLIRTVTLPDGSVKHYDNFFTRYQPWNDFYTYGAGVQPPAGAQVIDPRVNYAPPPAVPSAPRHRQSAEEL